MLLKEDTTCWRAGEASRAAIIVDVADYFAAVKAAIRKARRSVHILGWVFHPKTILDHAPPSSDPDACGIAAFLREVADARPELDVRVLCWKAALPVAITQGLYPQRAGRCFEGSRVRFVLDGRLPTGASHHQKVVVVDDKVAFAGGCDFGPDRWDTCDHEDENPRRAAIPGEHPCFDARHEVMSLVDGAPAQALGELFRERWLRATGEVLASPRATRADPWPGEVVPQFEDVRVGLSRSRASWRGHPKHREVETLYLASIAAARSCIYLENQYFTSPMIAEALAKRLGEPAGPEVILVSTEHSPSYFDQMTMDRTRSLFIKRLKDADRFGRFRIYSPVTAMGRTIIVHAKIAIIDDVLLRIGSANLNNRSMGFDTECDVSIEPAGDTRTASRAAIRAVRTRLLAHWLACEDAVLDRAVRAEGGIGAGIEALRRRGHCRLRPIEPTPLKPLAAFVATFHIGDPVGAWDAWMPWLRRAAARRELARVASDLRSEGLPASPARLSPKTV
ncbi:MAG: phospholipase [Phenylobacterium zucineum]|nr:MAG: phospholipase [Phenylobacterium zucineum]